MRDDKTGQLYVSATGAAQRGIKVDMSMIQHSQGAHIALDGDTFDEAVAYSAMPDAMKSQLGTLPNEPASDSVIVFGQDTESLDARFLDAEEGGNEEQQPMSGNKSQDSMLGGIASTYSEPMKAAGVDEEFQRLADSYRSMYEISRQYQSQQQSGTVSLNDLM